MSEIIAGKNALLEILKSERKVKRIFLVQGIREDKTIGKIKKIALVKNIPLTYLSKEKIALKSPVKVHQGVLALVEPFSYFPFDSFLKSMEVKNSALVLVLDGVTDPQNFGSLLRTCEVAGVDGVLLRKKRSVKVTPTVYKVSTGAVEHVPIIQVSNLSYACQRLKEIGFWIVGAETNASKNYWEIDFTNKVGLILGSEGKGISPLLKKHCDDLAQIPQVGKVTSLNVSVAGAIFIFEAMRQKWEG